jgi:hypothetical protein
MTQDIISSYFEKARTSLKAEHDKMVQNVKDEVTRIKQRTISKI